MTNGRDVFKKLGVLSDDMLLEAENYAGEQIRKRKERMRMRTGILAAAAAGVMVVSAALLGSRAGINREEAATAATAQTVVVSESRETVCRVEKTEEGLAFVPYTEPVVFTGTGRANVYAAMDEQSPVVGKAVRNAAAELLSVQDGWYEIAFGGRSGYVRADKWWFTGDRAENWAENKAVMTALSANGEYVAYAVAEAELPLQSFSYQGGLAVEETGKQDVYRLRRGDNVGYLKNEGDLVISRCLAEVMPWTEAAAEDWRFKALAGLPAFADQYLAHPGSMSWYGIYGLAAYHYFYQDYRNELVEIDSHLPYNRIDGEIKAYEKEEIRPGDILVYGTMNWGNGQAVTMGSVYLGDDLALFLPVGQSVNPLYPIVADIALLGEPTGYYDRAFYLFAE